MDIATVTGAYQGLKATKEILSALFDAKIDAESKAKIIEAQARLGEVQDMLFALREELFRLQDEGNQLRRQLADAESWNARLADYELVKTAGGAVVYHFKAQPEHYVCPSCTSKQELHILQTNRSWSDNYKCTGCNSEYPIEPQREFRI